eukprot:s5236_g12.t1
MAGLESVPAFTERAKQIGISEELLKKFVKKNLDTYGKLAFICSSRPSSGDDKALFDSIKELTGSEVPVEQQSIVRRLWYEAHSHALVDLEARASRTGESSPREMPLAERLTRLKRQRVELKGLELDVHTEPGHALVDRVQAMLDTAQVLHIAPEKCISRHDEILGDKSEQKLSLGADGNIKITKQASSLRCETTGVGMPAPLDKHIAAASYNQFVMSCLTHLPKPPESPAQLWKPHKGGKGDKGENSKGGKNGKGKSKGGKNNQSKADASPNTSLKELLDSLPEGCVRATDEGRFICPFYNKGLCRFQMRKSCRFGKHVCNFKGCGSERPYIECRH